MKIEGNWKWEWDDTCKQCANLRNDICLSFCWNHSKFKPDDEK